MLGLHVDRYSLYEVPPVSLTFVSFCKNTKNKRKQKTNKKKQADGVKLF